jgi:CBS domain-containing protein
MADLTVAEVMDREPMTNSPGEDVQTLIRRLRKHELPGLPVVDDGRLDEIGTRVDTLAALTRE